ncbi:MAG: recombinase family protein [bacterium]|nr:recombinase family protein [bacterium]
MKEEYVQKEKIPKENVKKENMQEEIQQAGFEQPAFFSQKIWQKEEVQKEQKEKQEYDEYEEYEEQKEQKRKQLRVAAYIRVSTDSSGQEESYETQLAYFSGILMKNPAWISAGVYCDYGVSGTSEEKRIGFQRLMRHCGEGRIDRIVSKSVSRFARNTRDFLKALEMLKKNHVTIAFEKEGLDTAVVQNDLFFTAFAAVAQEESRSISSNVSWGIRRRYPNGEARNFVVYGYRYAKGEQAVQVTQSGYRFRQVEVIPERAETVRRIFSELAQGKTYISVARDLNFDRIGAPESAVFLRRKAMAQTPKGRLKKGLDEGWTAAHIRRIVYLERYTGDVKLQKTYKPDYRSPKKQINQGELPQYYVRNHHPAVIDREMFLNVEKVRVAKKKMSGLKEEKKIHPFSGKLVCSQCGRFYWTRNRKSRPVWYCASTAQNNGKCVCHAERIYEKQLVRVCCVAVIERYELFGERWQKDDRIYTVAECGSENSEFIRTLIQKMEHIQQADEMEQDCMFLKRQIAKSQTCVWEAEQSLEGMNESLETSREAKGSSGLEEETGALEQKIRHISQELAREQRRVQKLSGQLEHLEQYWMELEADYEWRQKAIAWMRELPDGWQGIAGFLQGMDSGYMRAFILTIEIISPFLYRIHWFDDVWTEVRMYTNVSRGNWNEEVSVRMQEYEKVLLHGENGQKGQKI